MDRSGDEADHPSIAVHRFPLRDLFMTLRSLLDPLRHAQRDFAADTVRGELHALFTPEAAIHLTHPFEDLEGVDELVDLVLAPLADAFPDLERRDLIVMDGRTAEGAEWIGCCGHWSGTFARPWLDIPPTAHQAAMRFHEFYRVEAGRVVEMQAVWDIPELLMQAGAWPMSPSLGREWHVPGPATQDGLAAAERDRERAAASLALVGDMLEHLGRFATDGVEGMMLERFWHPAMSWYGPSGIGTARGIAGFRNWHQIPFLNAMPDRTGGTDDRGHLFADGDYVGFTGWPGMSMSVSGDGWLGIAPSGREITMRSLDFWRCEGTKIRENWVLIDLLHVYDQLGVNVLARARELSKARRGCLDP